MKCLARIMCCLGAMVLIAPGVYGKDHKQRVAWRDVPATAQAAITENFGKARVIEVDKTINKQLTIYEAELKMPDGTTTIIWVTTDGKVVKVKKHASHIHAHRALFG